MILSAAAVLIHGLFTEAAVWLFKIHNGIKYFRHPFAAIFLCQPVGL